MILDRQPSTSTRRRSAHAGQPAALASRWAALARRPLAALLVLLAVGCGQQQASQATSAPPAAPSAAAQPTQAAPTRAATTSGTFQNPVLRADFPDPFILHVGSLYYAYATNAGGKNVQVARSSDLVHWEQLADAMPQMASWAKVGGSLVWAPEVLALGNRYLLYYTARDTKSDRQCVGVASSDKPEGRFQDASDHALVCQVDQGGTIDPDPFRDQDGSLYLYYKNDGNCCSQPTYLYAQRLAPDGLSVTGEPARLVRNDQGWEGNVIEAPTMINHEGKYYLFFSANDYAGVPYAVGYATCTAALGPCQDAAENPILASQTKQKPLVIGPGHQAIVQLGDQTWIVYHAWEINQAGTRGGRRLMWLDRIEWNDGKPDVIGPTTDLQPLPTP